MPRASDTPAGTRAGPMGVFGGTFDPVHYGHLRTAFELYQALALAEIRFLPAGNPPHRERPVASTEVRLAMVAAAIAGSGGFVLDDRETRRSGPSYTVETLEYLRGEFPDRSLCLLIGMDAFLGLPKWHQWRDILSLAHVVVAHRPGWRAPDSGFLGDLLRARRTQDPAALHASPAGRVHVQPVTQLEISSTDLRALIAAGLDPKFLMPDSVRRIILETECYVEAT